MTETKSDTAAAPFTLRQVHYEAGACVCRVAAGSQCCNHSVRRMLGTALYDVSEGQLSNGTSSHAGRTTGSGGSNGRKHSCSSEICSGSVNPIANSSDLRVDVGRASFASSAAAAATAVRDAVQGAAASAATSAAKTTAVAAGGSAGGSAGPSVALDAEAGNVRSSPPAAGAGGECAQPCGGRTSFEGAELVACKWAGKLGSAMGSPSAVDRDTGLGTEPRAHPVAAELAPRGQDTSMAETPFVPSQATGCRLDMFAGPAESAEQHQVCRHSHYPQTTRTPPDSKETQTNALLQSNPCMFATRFIWILSFAHVHIMRSM